MTGPGRRPARPGSATGQPAPDRAAAPDVARQPAGTGAGNVGHGGLRHLIVVVFLLAAILPIVLQAGSLRLSPYRLLLLAAAFPCMILWLRGSAGKIRLADLALLLMCLWTTLSYAVNHGLAAALEGGGIFSLETMGAYLSGRLLVRSPEDFRKMVATLFWIVLALLPLALLEAASGQAIVLETVGKLFNSHAIVHQDPRWGLRRVQGPFGHPILFGAFCGSSVGMVWYVLGHGRSFPGRVLRTLLVGASTVLSLSSGPLTSMAAQLALILWDQMLRRFKARWQVLAGMLVTGVIAIEIVANRSAAQILITFVAFNPSTAFNRLRIWQYGSASVLNHPWLGIGLNEWERPSWMLASIDMFWLVPAVRHGLPAGLLLQAAFFAAVLPVMFAKGLDARSASYRTGYIISMLGLYISGWTVHYWDSVYILLMFFLGAGSWIVAIEPAAAPGAADRRRDRRRRAATGAAAGTPDRDRRATLPPRP